MKAEPRRAIPMKTQRDVALRQLADLMRQMGMEVTRLELDHDPALGRRLVDEATGQHVPHQHEPSCLIWRPDAAHKVKTFGKPATTLGSDIHEIAKTVRMEREAAEFRVSILRKETGEPKPERYSAFGKRPRNQAKPQRRASGYVRRSNA